MTTKKPRPPLKLKAIKPMAPDDPFYSRGWFVGGFRGGPRPGAKPAPSPAETSHEPQHDEHADDE